MSDLGRFSFEDVGSRLLLSLFGLIIVGVVSAKGSIDKGV